jgi:ketosteroid isomerase-like protein
MKKNLILTALILLGISCFAQKKNGTVFIEHPLIEKTLELWKAFENGDKDAYAAMLADSMVAIYNGNSDNPQTRENNINGVTTWGEQYDNLEVVADAPAFADAIEYTTGGSWVQDWLLIKGTHKETGINLNLKEHHLYRFNEDGKITVIFYYFNNDVFEEIRNSKRTKENGKVYINHPHIVTVRKLVNAYCAENIDAMLEFFNPDATFNDMTMKWRESLDLEEEKQVWADRFEEYDEIKMTQVGYPDCIYYELNDDYVVYSWWIHSSKSVEDGTVVEFPIMFSQTFDKDGKIVNSMEYYSTNHFEE